MYNRSNTVSPSVGIQSGSKIGTIVLYALILLTNFQNYFTVRIRRKFVIILAYHLNTKDPTTPQVWRYITL